MTNFEKILVNRRRKGTRNITIIRDLLKELDFSQVQSILEIGCGTGAVSAFLASTYDAEVIGTDFDPEQIKIARSRHQEKGHLRFQIEDASKLTFADESFDIAISQNVFHHISNWQLALREIFRVLKLGGYFIWMDLAFPEVITKLFRPIVKDYGVFTINDVREACRVKGMLEISSSRMPHGFVAHHQLLLRKP
jgi:ubiquinone/menaquinone biosynthesis C-methylase UbiE